MKGTKRILFKEKGWTIAKSDGPYPYVEHLECRWVSFGAVALALVRVPEGKDDEYIMRPTYIEHLDCCFWCRERFPDFISNMWTFVRWCRE